MADLNDTARFTINGTASSDPTTGDRIFVGTNGQTLTCTLETNPSTGLSTTFEVYDAADSSSPLASKDAPLLLWNENSLPRIKLATVNADATIDLPAVGVESYIIRCSVSTSEGTAVFEREACIFSLTTSPPIRKTVPAESTQARARAWSDAFNDYLDAIAAGGGSTVPGGNSTNVQWNNAGVFAGEDDLAWITGNKTLTVGAITGGAVAVVGDNSDAPMALSQGGTDAVPLQRMLKTGTNPATVELLAGDRDPNGAVTGNAGAVYFRTDTGTPANSDMYVNVDGSTTWTSTLAGATANIAATLFVVTTPAAPNEFATFGAAAIAAAAIDGVVEISISASETVAVQAYALANVRIVPKIIGPGLVPTLTFPTGATWTSVPLFTNVNVTFSGAGSLYTSPAALASAMLVESAALNVTGGGKFLDLTASTSGTFAIVARGSVFSASSGSLWDKGVGGGTLFINQFDETVNNVISYPGTASDYEIHLSSGSRIDVNFPPTVTRVFATDRFLNVDVTFSGTAVPNLLGHVDTLAGTFTVTLPDPSVGATFEQGQTVLLLDSGKNANANPLTIATTGVGTIDDLPGYSLNKSGDIAWLIPSDPFAADDWNILTKWGRFQGELVVDGSAGKNAFQTINDALKVADGYPGRQRLRFFDSVSTVANIDWSTYNLCGNGPTGNVLTFGIGASWTAAPNEIVDLGVAITAAGLSILSATFPRCIRTSFDNTGATAAAFIHNTVSTTVTVDEVRDSTFVGDPTEGLFFVGGSGAVVVMHVYGACSFDANVFIQDTGTGQGTFELILHDPDLTTVAAQNLMPAGTFIAHGVDWYHHAEETTPASITGTTAFQSYLVMTTSTFLPAGEYEIDYHYVWSHDAADSDYVGQILLDGSTDIMNPSGSGSGHQQEPKDPNANQRQHVSGKHRVTLTAGAHTFDMQYATSAGGAESFIYTGEMTLRRVFPSVT